MGIKHNEAVYPGDDYGLGGNDESVYKSDFGFICVDDGPYFCHGKDVAYSMLAVQELRDELLKID